MIKSKRIWLFQMPILDEMKMTDRAAEIEVQQILAQGNNAQRNRVTFPPFFVNFENLFAFDVGRLIYSTVTIGFCNLE